MSLDNKVAIVTGANSGIGRSIALALAKAGASITIDYVVNPESAEELEKEINKLGEKAIMVDADVSKLDDLHMLVEQTVQAFGHLDVMVINAGIETRTSVLETSEEQYDKVMAVNLKSAFFGTSAAAKLRFSVLVRAISATKVLPYTSSAGGWVKTRVTNMRDPSRPAFSP